ncbi:MAG: hypothetical protein KGJ06_04625 [Pseudomonadota bacterium]|nr:hypothetical protein [Pseudomonadota bacterium]
MTEDHSPQSDETASQKITRDLINGNRINKSREIASSWQVWLGKEDRNALIAQAEALGFANPEEAISMAMRTALTDIKILTHNVKTILQQAADRPQGRAL